MLDSPFTHVDAWPGVRIDSRMPLPSDYDALPRGRVLYVPAQGRWLVYGDGPLIGAASAKPLRPEVVALRQAVSDFFGFVPEAALWRHDPHYTVGRQRIARLLDDD